MSSLSASIKRIGSKTTEKRWRHHFPHYKSMGAFCCQGNQSFDPIWPKTLWSLSSIQMMLHIKFDQDWPTGFRDIPSSKVWNFRHSRASNSKMSGLIRPIIELNWAFMPVLVTSNFDDDSIKTERASMETPFPHYKSMRNFLDAEGQLTLKSVDRSGRHSNSSEILCMSSLPASIRRIGSKATEKRWRHHFPNYKSIRAFCYHGHPSFDPICLKTLCSLSPPQVMLHIKFDQDWPSGLKDLQVRKCKIFFIQGQVTPKWVVWSGLKLNLSELLCLSWLPATLLMIRSKMNELAWRQHFTIISQWEIF